ncbi:hypothetical protein BDV33DRAFT_102364 [Aspergillus novoparasiticus]|uniref:Uncharacterized protein n=1 Tax=Aspergillus novoparasiticus TaxID=986946 RepID=A0A5N6EU48_9EURO|nr:hypothetical protein BDV33DRAFT_102364 [Aspergillus novoparasiticus]
MPPPAPMCDDSPGTLTGETDLGRWVERSPEAGITGFLHSQRRYLSISVPKRKPHRQFLIFAMMRFKRFPPLGSEAVSYGPVGRKSPRLSQLPPLSGILVEDSPSMRYEVILFIFFIIIILAPLLPLSRYSGHRRSEVVVPSTVKGKSKASSDHHSLLLTIEINAYTYPLN